MNLAELEVDERVALVALAMQLIRADRKRTPEEMEEFREIADEMGKDAFDEAMSAAIERVGPNGDAVAFAKKTISRPQVRELARTILIDLARSDDPDAGEGGVVKAIEKAWGRKAG